MPQKSKNFFIKAFVALIIAGFLFTTIPAQNVYAACNESSLSECSKAELNSLWNKVQIEKQVMQQTDEYKNATLQRKGEMDKVYDERIALISQALQAANNLPPTQTGSQSSDSGVQGILSTNIPVLGFIIKVIIYIALHVVGVGISVVGYLVSSALSLNQTLLNFDPPFILTGWTIFRDIANLGFVFAIIVIAISTILRLKSYTINSVLPKLIIAAIIVNFSLVIAGIPIKISDVFSNYFLEAITGSGINENGTADSIAAAARIGDAFHFNSLVNSFSNPGGAGFFGMFFGVTLSEIAGMLILTILGIIMFLVLLAFAGMLFIRYFYLGFLLMLSPIVWLLWALPSTRGWFKQWWQKFIHWVYYAPLVLLFLYITLAVLQKYSEYAATFDAQFQAANDVVGTRGKWTYGALMTVLFATALLIGGMKTAQVSSLGGTKLAMNFAEKTGKWAKSKTSTAVRRGAARAGNALSQTKAGKATMGGLKTAALKISQKPTTKTGRGILGAANFLTGGGLAAVRKGTKEAAIGIDKAQSGLQKVSYEQVADDEKRLKDLSADQLIEKLSVFNKSELTAAMKILADKDKLEKTTKNKDDLGRLNVAFNILKDYGKKDEGEKMLKKAGLNEDALKQLLILAKNPADATAQGELKTQLTKVWEGMSDDDYKAFIKNQANNVVNAQYFGLDPAISKDIIQEHVYTNAAYDVSKLKPIGPRIKEVDDIKKFNTALIGKKLGIMNDYITEFQKDINAYAPIANATPQGSDQRKKLSKMTADLSKMQSEKARFDAQYNDHKAGGVIGDEKYDDLVKMMGNSNTSTIREMRDFAHSLKVV